MWHFNWPVVWAVKRQLHAYLQMFCLATAVLTASSGRLAASTRKSDRCEERCRTHQLEYLRIKPSVFSSSPCNPTFYFQNLKMWRWRCSSWCRCFQNDNNLGANAGRLFKERLPVDSSFINYNQWSPTVATNVCEMLNPQHPKIHQDVLCHHRG